MRGKEISLRSSLALSLFSFRICVSFLSSGRPSPPPLPERIRSNAAQRERKGNTKDRIIMGQHLEEQTSKQLTDGDRGIPKSGHKFQS